MTDIAARTDADPGLLGPDTVTWQLHADPAMWVAGIRSLFLQALHPRTVAAVVQNSNFQEDPFGRLLRTADFVSVSTYGTTEQVLGYAGRVRKIHRALRATDPDTGELFAIDEPELLLWVHCAEVASFLDVVRRAGYPLTGGQADRYLDEQRQTAALVGLDADQVPGSRAEMGEYFAAVRPDLHAAADAEVIYQFLHNPPVAPLLRPGVPFYTAAIGHLAYSLLPRWAIELYGHPGYEPTGATALLRTLRLTVLRLPELLLARRGQPPIKAAIARLGPWATPSARNLPDC
ncbi:MAG TPA: oxygenase MpaB family protein [Pseudonocardiaceae bacterium]|jgi:uncharacterized protein (DUF2236 family)|nr:oxygenase MpaB family protein [Pseudonocardiaceae bacterium]